LETQSRKVSMLPPAPAPLRGDSQGAAVSGGLGQNPF